MFSVEDSDISELQKQLTAARGRKAHYIHELERIRLAKNLHSEKLRNKLKQIEDEKRRTESDYERILLQKDEEIKRRRNVLSEMKLLPQVELIEEDLSCLSEENQLIGSEVIDLEYKLEEAYLAVEDLQESNRRLEENAKSNSVYFDELQNRVESRSKELEEAKNQKLNLEETYKSVTSELHSLNCAETQAEEAPVNSLFEEVNCRRLKEQDELLVSHQKCTELKAKLDKVQKQFVTVKVHHAECVNLANDIPIEQKQNYETLMDMHKNRINLLERLCKEYERVLLEQQNLSTSGLVTDAVKFLQSMFSKFDNEMEFLNNLNKNECLSHKIITLETKEILQEIEQLKISTKSVAAKLSEVQQNIRELLNKKEEVNNVPGTSSVSVLPFEEDNKENASVPLQPSKQATKKVKFAEEIKDDNQAIRRRGKKVVLKCKPFFIDVKKI